MSNRLCCHPTKEKKIRNRQSCLIGKVRRSLVWEIQVIRYSIRRGFPLTNQSKGVLSYDCIQLQFAKHACVLEKLKLKTQRSRRYSVGIRMGNGYRAKDIERVVVSRSDLQGACTRTIPGKHTRFSTSPPQRSLHMTRRGVEDGALPPDQRLVWKTKHQASRYLKEVRISLQNHRN